MKFLQKFQWLAIILLLVIPVSVPSMANDDPGPPPLDTPEAKAVYQHALAENTDLAAAMAKADAALAFIAACKGAKCPKIDCELAGQLWADMKGMEFILRAYINYAEKAKDAHLAHHRSLVEQSIQTGTNLSNAQNALAWQKYLHDLSKSIADVASLLDTAKSLGQKGFGENWADALEMVDSIEQRLDTIDGLSGRIGGSLGAEGLGDVYTSPVVGSKDSGLSTPRKGVVDSAKTFRKIKNEMKKIREATPDIKPGDAFKQAIKNKWSPTGAGKAFMDQKEGLRKSFIGWIHKGLVAYDNKLMAERKARIDALVNDLSAEQRVIAEAFLGYQKALREMELAERTMQKVKEVLAGLPGCMAKAKCPTSSLGFQMPFIPDFSAAANNSQHDRWGEALRYLRNMVKEQANRMTVPHVEDNCGEEEDKTALHLGDDNKPFVLVGTDSVKWCRFRPETVILVPVGGGDDDPRDTPLPGGGDDEGDDPRDTPPPGGGDDDDDDPRDTPPPGGGGGPTITATPNDDDDPRDVPPSDDDDDDPRDAPKIYILVKATSSAQSEGSKAAKIPGQQIKFFPTAVADPMLPGDGDKDTKTGASEDPVQGVTDNKGEVKIAANPTAIGLGKNSQNLTLAVNLDPTETGLVAPAGTTIDGRSEPDEKVTVAGKEFWIFYLPAATAEKLVAGDIQINLCGIKEPVGPGTYSSAPMPLSEVLPGVTLTIGAGEGVLP